jgi:thiamine biosynthesis lipoprotein ApbE
VVAPSGMEADANATALSVLGCARGLGYIETQPRLAALFLQSANGKTSLVESKRFRQMGDLH